MKTTLVTLLGCGALLATAAFAQTPTPAASPVASVTGTSLSPTPAATIAALSAASPSPTADAEEDDSLEARIDRKVKKHFQINIGGGEHRARHSSSNSDGDDLGALIAIPIVGIIFSTLFGAPIIIVGLIMFFSFWKQRSLHKTVRAMVEKGQPVPEALFATPIIRARSDMRRGIVLLMVGLGLMIFLGAANDWSGGGWAIGAIPFLMGAGYLAVWKLEGNRPGPASLTQQSTDNPPRTP